MSVQTTSGKNPAEKTGLIAQWRDYVELCKPKVIALMLFTVIVGMLMAPHCFTNVFLAVGICNVSVLFRNKLNNI